MLSLFIGRSSTSRSRSHIQAKVDVVSKLETKCNVQLVRLPVLLKYIEYDRTKDFKHERGEKYLEKLQQRILKEGLKQPLVLAVSKQSQRAYLSEGNHRIVCLDRLDVHWVPLQVGYWFLNDDNDSAYPFIPAILKEFPKDITPSLCGFEVREI